MFTSRVHRVGHSTNFEISLCWEFHFVVVFNVLYHGNWFGLLKDVAVHLGFHLIVLIRIKTMLEKVEMAEAYFPSSTMSDQPCMVRFFETS